MSGRRTRASVPAGSHRDYSRTAFPVTTGRLPGARCQACGRFVPYRPGEQSAAQALTAHYGRHHPEVT